MLASQCITTPGTLVEGEMEREGLERETERGDAAEAETGSGGKEVGAGVWVGPQLCVLGGATVR